jgi:DNA-binding NtrC family response regulator
MITSSELPFDGFAGPADLVAAASQEQWSLDELEKRYIREVLRRTGGNYSRAAAILGINRKTLFEKRRRWGLDSE